MVGVMSKLLMCCKYATELAIASSVIGEAC